MTDLNAPALVTRGALDYHEAQLEDLAEAERVFARMLSRAHRQGDTAVADSAAAALARITTWRVAHAEARRAVRTMRLRLIHGGAR